MSREDRRDRASCSSPIDEAVLSDYWIAALPAEEEAAVEEHLLACDQCGDRLREVIALAEGIRRLAGEGSLRMIVSDTFVKRAEEAGLQVRQYSPSAGGSVSCTVVSEDDLLIARFAASMKGAKQVDLCLCDGNGVEQVRLPDIPVDPDAGGVIYQESMTFAKALPSTTLIARLVALDETGAERLLGDYTFNHTRSIPGPGPS